MTDEVIRNRQEVADLVSAGALDSCMVQEVDLSRIGLAGVRANDVTFKRVGLHDADARGADFGRVKFSESSLRGADFGGSLMRGCSFFSCELIEGGFEGTTMSGSSFYNTRLGNGNFTGSRIQSAVFNACELFGAKFARTLLLNTRFDAPERGNVTLDRADFSNAVLIDCDLMGANLFGANFDNALLVKVDLRHANIAQASFQGAHLIDVHLDTSLLEPAQRREVEAARVDDPWRRHGFMVDVLASHSDDELKRILEYVLRTYVIEGAQPSEQLDSFAMLLAQLKARHDFPELQSMRLRGTAVQVRLGTEWHDLIGGAGPVVRSAGEPTPDVHVPAPPPAAMASTPAESPPSPAPPVDANRAPKNVGRSKRFKRLEID